MINKEVKLHYEGEKGRKDGREGRRKGRKRKKKAEFTMLINNEGRAVRHTGSV